MGIESPDYNPLLRLHVGEEPDASLPPVDAYTEAYERNLEQTMLILCDDDMPKTKKAEMLADLLTRASGIRSGPRLMIQDPEF